MHEKLAKRIASIYVDKCRANGKDYADIWVVLVCNRNRDDIVQVANHVQAIVDKELPRAK